MGLRDAPRRHLIWLAARPCDHGCAASAERARSRQYPVYGSGAEPFQDETTVSGTRTGAPDTAHEPCDYLTSERRRKSSPMTSGSAIQMAVVEASIAHSLAVSVSFSNRATWV